MKIQIDEAKQLSSDLLMKWGFSGEDADYCTDLLIEAELCGKPSHGLMRLVSLKKMIDDGRVEVNDKGVDVEKETSVSMLIDGKRKTGLCVVPRSLDMAIEKMDHEKLGLLMVGVNNTSPAAGMIGYYARKAAENDFVYIGFHNSMSYLVPFGAKESLWGTNPVTIGVPSNNGPVIWDCSAGKASVGDIVLAKRQGTKIPIDIALDKNGRPTNDPVEALKGGILPFAKHKGSGMAMMVELLAGALIGSSVTKDSQWNWGSFYILLDPNVFQPINEYKEGVVDSIAELKSLSKEGENNEILYPGEKSQSMREECMERGSFDLSKSTYVMLGELLG